MQQLIISFLSEDFGAALLQAPKRDWNDRIRMLIMGDSGISFQSILYYLPYKILNDVIRPKFRGGPKV